MVRRWRNGHLGIMSVRDGGNNRLLLGLYSGRWKRKNSDAILKPITHCEDGTHPRRHGDGSGHHPTLL